MTRRKKSKAGRPPLGDKARTHTILLRLTEAEHAHLAAEVARANAERGEDAPAVTVSGLVRERALGQARTTGR